MRKNNNVEIPNQQGTFSKEIEFAILPKIRNNTQVSKLDISNLCIPEHINLTDDNFHIPV